jgi:hypothetical protein
MGANLATVDSHIEAIKRWRDAGTDRFPSSRLWTRSPDAFFDCRPSLTGIAHRLF